MRRTHPELLDEALWHLEEPIADLSCLGFICSAGWRASTSLSRSPARAPTSCSAATASTRSPRAPRSLRAPFRAPPAARSERRAPPESELDTRARDCGAAPPTTRRASTRHEPRLRRASGGLLHPDFRATRRPRPRSPDARSPSTCHTGGGSTLGRDATSTRAGARRQHAPVLRQDVDGRDRSRCGSRSWTTSSCPSARGSPTRRRVSRMLQPQGAAQAREPRPRRRLRSSTSEEGLLPRGPRRVAHPPPRRSRARDAARRAGAGARHVQPLDGARPRGARQARRQEGHQRLFSLLALERWQQLFVDGGARAAQPRSLASRRLAPMPNPRILILVQNEPLPQDRHVWNQCRGAERAGYDVTVDLPAGRPPAMSEPHQRCRASTSTATGRAPPMAAALGYGLEYSPRCGAWASSRGGSAKRAPFDLVHACSPPDFLLLAMLQALAVAGRALHLRPSRLDARAVLASRFGQPRGLVYRADPARRAGGVPARRRRAVRQRVVPTGRAHARPARARGRARGAHRAGPGPASPPSPSRSSSAASASCSATSG